MRFEGVVDVAAPRHELWDFLVDPRRVTTCAPGARDLELLANDRFKVVSSAGVGAIRATFAFDVLFAVLVPPERAEIIARGQSPGSAVEMRSAIKLEDLDGALTRVVWSSDVVVSGALAGIGARLIETAAGTISRQVFECVRTKLGATP